MVIRVWKRMDSFCERGRVSNAMGWRGRMRVNDGQKKWSKSPVCDPMNPREQSLRLGEFLNESNDGETIRLDLPFV